MNDILGCWKYMDSSRNWFQERKINDKMSSVIHIKKGDNRLLNEEKEREQKILNDEKRRRKYI